MLKKVAITKLNDLTAPFHFRERNGEVEGQVGSPLELIDKFEPVDVLNGVTELVDAAGKTITIVTDDPRDIEDNEYHDKAKLYLSYES